MVGREAEVDVAMPPVEDLPVTPALSCGLIASFLYLRRCSADLTPV
jgi:hypothetical protein